MEIQPKRHPLWIIRDEDCELKDGVDLKINKEMIDR